MRSDVRKDAAVLRILSERLGEVVSGEELAIGLGVSRVALHKRIKRLMKMGVPIESLERKGYVLRELPDTLIEPVVLSLLETKIIARDYIFYDVIDSTNEAAKRLIEEKQMEEGLVICADQQTSGRGRLGRKWFSPKEKNLYFTVILTPQIPPSKFYHVTMTASVAVCESLRDLGLPALIKWPNDIYVNQKKICGILTEILHKDSQTHFVILGIGLNVKKQSFPSDIQQKATSVELELGSEIRRLDVFVDVLQRLDRWYIKLAKSEVAEIFSFWRENNYTIGKKVLVDGKLSGYAVGITPFGELLVRLESGDVVKVSSGDVDIID